jgi:hypothetical protein
MAVDEQLAARVRAAIRSLPAVTEKRMFGGIAFLVNGRMAVGVHRDELIVRLSPTDAVQALAEPGVRVFDITGRPMKGWLLVGARGVEGAALGGWVQRGIGYARGLPPK